MKVLLRKNIDKLGIIGDVVEVKNGYARNYLLPQSLATQPTEANIRKVEQDRAGYLEELARQQADLKARASLLDGKEITISARANEEGHLYGSIGPAQIAAAMAENDLFVEAENIVMDHPIRQLDKYDIQVRFAEDITAAVGVWVVPLREDGDEADPAAEAPAEAEDEDESTTAEQPQDPAE